MTRRFYLLFRLQLPFVRGNERTNVVRHVEQLEPLLFVQSHGKPSHPIDREGALFTHFHASSGRCSLLEGGIFFAQTLELRFQIVRHASSSSPPPGGRAGLPPDTRWVADAQSGAATFSNRGIESRWLSRGNFSPESLVRDDELGTPLSESQPLQAAGRGYKIGGRCIRDQREQREHACEFVGHTPRGRDGKKASFREKK